MTRPFFAVLAICSVFATPHALADDTPRFVLHLESNAAAVRFERRAKLVQSDDGSDPDLTWREICTAPCDRPIDRNGVYRIGGKGLIPSAPLAIPPGDLIEINAKASSVAKRTTGVVLTVLASVALSSALVATEVGTFNANPAGPYQPDVGWLVTGGALAVAGIVGYAVGLPLLFSSGTHVEIRGSAYGELSAK